ncbi:MAG: 50S ribosomal protein L10 [Flavobacteriaceae bacterium]|nr:50S ribosomal protein L10 [Flavobacteriaceae bacterium]
MTKEQKTEVVNKLANDLVESKVLYFTDIAGLNSKNTSELRRACFNAGIRLSVVKNTLLERAMESCEKDFSEFKDVLKGNTSLMFSNVGNAPAKVIKNFRRKHEKPILKGAYVEESIYLGDNQIDSLVSIKSKEELIGDIISLLQSPAKNVISALKSSGNQLSGILKTLSDR